MKRDRLEDLGRVAEISMQLLEALNEEELRGYKHYQFSKSHEEEAHSLLNKLDELRIWKERVDELASEIYQIARYGDEGE